MNRMSHLSRWLLPLILCTLLIGTAMTASAAPPEATEAFDYHKSTLKNGLNVVALEDFSCPIVSVQIWYHVGSKNENPERQGFAHMFEHMMFRGTDRLGPTDHFNLVRRTGGTVNAYTSFDMTVYYEILPANQLELALWLEAERMAFLKIDQESFDTERKVVEEERRMGLSRPYGTVSEKLFGELFKVHPYRWTPIGNIPHLRAATVDELQAFWNRYYVPNNATLVIVGAVPHEQAQQMAEKYFGWIPRSDDPARVTIREPVPTEQREAELSQRNAPLPMVGISYRTVPMVDDAAVPLRLLASILGGGQSSRLYRDLVAENQLAVQANSMIMPLEHHGMLAAMAVLSPRGGDPDKVLEVIEQHIERLRDQPVTQGELAKAKNQMLKGLVTQNLSINSKARALGQAAVVEGDVSRVNRELENIRRVTVEDLQRVARTYLAADRSLVFRVPRSMLGAATEKPAEEADSQQSTETDEPTAAAKKDFQRPDDFPAKPPIAGLLKDLPEMEFSEKTLSNGLKVLVVPNHEVPFVSIRLGLLSGGFTEQKIGAASMAMDMLTKGTEGHTEGELAEELETYAISLSGSSGSDTAAVSASCLTEHTGRAMQLLAEVTRRPTFPEDEFEKLRRQVLAGLEVSSVTPTYLASREMDRLLYGDHPYARTGTGEIDDVKRLAVKDLKRWWRRFVRPDMAVLIFAGDIDQAQAMELTREALGDWKAKGPRPKVDLPKFPEAKETHIYLVDQPGSVQSQIRIGQLGMTRKDPGYFTSVLVSDYFGGAFDSRLNEAVRVKKGLTYGARGGFQTHRFGGAFVASTFTKTASTAEVVSTVLEEIERLRVEAPTAEELKKRQTYYLGSFARQRETPQQVAGDLWLIESNDLPEDHFQTMLGAIGQVEPSQCLALAKEAIHPSKLAIVVVGDAANLKEDLEKIAPVTVVKLPASEEE